MTKREMIEAVLAEQGWKSDHWGGNQDRPVVFVDGWFELMSVDEKTSNWLTQGEQGTIVLHVPNCHDDLRELYGPDRVVAVLSRLEGVDHHAVVHHVNRLRRVDDLGDRVNASELFYEKLSLLGSTAYVDQEDVK